jgi:hypothetical protein
MSAGFDRWAMAWLILSLVLGLHVAEEAASGRFAIYDDLLDWIGFFLPFVEMPAFRYNMWLINLTGAVVVLIGLTWLVVTRQGPMRLASYVLAIFASANALLHIFLSVAAGELLPGTLTSPLVLAASLFLLISIPPGGGFASADL